MELHEYEWELREMAGREPSERDIWVAGGTSLAGLCGPTANWRGSTSA